MFGIKTAQRVHGKKQYIYRHMTISPIAQLPAQARAPVEISAIQVFLGWKNLAQRTHKGEFAGLAEQCIADFPRIITYN